MTFGPFGHFEHDKEHMSGSDILVLNSTIALLLRSVLPRIAWHSPLDKCVGQPSLYLADSATGPHESFTIIDFPLLLFSYFFLRDGADKNGDVRPTKWKIICRERSLSLELQKQKHL